jgi:methylase of polypeptide subunit release factors
MTTIETSTGVRSIEFGELEVSFDDRILHPRPWTTRQSLWARELLQTAPPGPVLELFCGAGHIGLLAVLNEPRGLVMVDADIVACEFATANADRAGIAARVDVRQGRIGDVLEPGATFALVIADPPWVPSDRVAEFPHDPLAAIDGGTDGLDLARQSAEVISGHLMEHGSAVVQLGTQAQADAFATYLTLRNDLQLHVVEVREQAGLGVLVRLDRRPHRAPLGWA